MPTPPSSVNRHSNWNLKVSEFHILSIGVDAFYPTSNSNKMSRIDLLQMSGISAAPNSTTSLSLKSFFPRRSCPETVTTRPQISSSEVSGMVCVIECEMPLSEIRQYLDSLIPSNLGPCTVIYSGHRATRNTVAVMTLQLYQNVEREIGLNKSPISKISRYVISSDNSPRFHEGQTEDIFLRFTPSEAMPQADLLHKSILEIMEELGRFNIIGKEVWMLDLPLRERNSSKVPMSYAFIKKRKNVPIEQSVCLRAVLNGIWLESCGVNIGAYWSDRGVNRKIKPPIPQDRRNLDRSDRTRSGTTN